MLGKIGRKTVEQDRIKEENYMEDAQVLSKPFQKVSKNTRATIMFMVGYSWKILLLLRDRQKS